MANLAAGEFGLEDGIFAELLAAEMTPDQLAEAHRLAQEWKAKPER